MKQMEYELKKWNMKDAEDMAFYANNVNISANLRNAFPYPYGLEDAAGFIRSCMEGDEASQLCRAIVVDGHAVGGIGIFKGVDVLEKSGELGYWLGEPYWGKGITTRAVVQLCREAFETMDLIRIYAQPFAYNLGSRRVLEKAGFSLEGIMKNGVYKRGRFCDYCMYALLKEGYQR